MKTKAELEQDIINITANIHRKSPELSKYISEMPDNIAVANTKGIDTKSLKEYYDTLHEVLTEYLKTHETEK